MAYYAPGTIIPSKLHLYQAKSQKQVYFRFLDLPAEIRNKIYELAFEECIVDIRFGRRDDWVNEATNPSSPPCPNPTNNQPGGVLQVTVNKIAEKPSRERLSKKPFKPRFGHQSNSPMMEPLQTEKEKPKARRRHTGARRSGIGPLRFFHNVLPLLTPASGPSSTLYQLPFHFLVGNRQVYNEALCVMYAKTTFRFECTQTLEKFLTRAPLRALQAIQGLDLSHATYGEPELTKDRKFKIKADRQWSLTCKHIRDRVTHLKRLRLSLEVNEWPTQLALREEWAKPILSLRGNGLDRVDATIFHSAFSEERLHQAARNLEIAMMSNVGRTAKNMEDKQALEQKKKTMESKARKVLVIKMDNIPTAKKAQKA
jgi:hypothetical protein